MLGATCSTLEGSNTAFTSPERSKVRSRRSPSNACRQGVSLCFSRVKYLRPRPSESRRVEPQCTWPHDMRHIWELVVPHLPFRFIDFQGLSWPNFVISSCNFFPLDLRFQGFMRARKVRRSGFPYVSHVMWPIPPSRNQPYAA